MARIFMALTSAVIFFELLLALTLLKNFGQSTLSCGRPCVLDLVSVGFSCSTEIGVFCPRKGLIHTFSFAFVVLEGISLSKDEFRIESEVLLVFIVSCRIVSFEAFNPQAVFLV